MKSPHKELVERGNAGEGMLVPTRARPSATRLVEGDGLPPKICVGAMDLEDDVTFSICNRDLTGDERYTKIRRVFAGMLALDTTPLQGNDQTYCGNYGLTIRAGTASDIAMENGEIIEIANTNEPSFCWQVVDEIGRSSLLITALPLDSFQIADALASKMKGTFHIIPVDAGIMTAADQYAIPTWNLFIESEMPQAFRPK